MILDMLLNESTSNVGKTDYTPVELESAHYTPDMDGMSEIVLESQERLMQLDEAVMLCEQISLSETIKGNSEKAMQLQEGAVQDFFAKIVQLLRDMWNRVTTFFKNLYKNIEIGVRDIVKVLDSHKKELDKDFANYEYSGYKWSKLDAQKYSNNAKKIIKEIDSFKKNMVGQLKAANSKNELSADELKKIKDKLENIHTPTEYKPDNLRNEIITGSNSSTKTHQQATLDITESYRSKTQENIKGFSDCSISNMVQFIKNFKNNEVLVKLKGDTDILFSESIKSAENTKSEMEKLRNAANTGSSQFNHGAFMVAYVKKLSTALTQTMNIYDSIMGVCITLEKQRYSEYKKAVLGAIRYNPKKK